MDCISGTFEAKAWHAGKHVAADPSGFNWRIDCEDIDLAIHGLTNFGQVIFTGPRTLVRMDNLQDRVVIHAYDTGLPEHPGRRTVLSSKGREQFLEVLRSVQDRECQRDILKRMGYDSSGNRRK